MNTAPAFVGLLIIFGMGACVGNNATPETKVETKTQIKIIRVPEVVTHVTTETKNIYKPLPVICKDAITELKKITPLDDAIMRESSKMNLLIDQAIQESAMADFKALNKTIVEMRDAEGKLGTAVADKSATETVLDRYIQQCDKETTN